MVIILFLSLLPCWDVTGFLTSGSHGFSMASEISAGSDQTEGRVDGDYVSIDFNNVDIVVFIKFISELTGRNFIVDNRVKGNVTVISPAKVSIKEAYNVFESVLNIHGFSTVASGDVIKIIPNPEARTQNLDTGPSNRGETIGDHMVTRIVPLRFADAQEMKQLLIPLVSKGSVILAYSDTNMLIITDTLSNIDRLLKIIDTVDVMGMGKKISVIPVEHADAVKLVKSLNTIFTARSRVEKGKTDPDMVVKFVADERTNAIVVLASVVETERVTALVNMLDKKVPKGEEKIRVYYLEHASAEKPCEGTAGNSHGKR